MVMSITLLVVFMLLMFLGVPIAISLGAASVFTIVTMSSLPLSMAAQSMFTSMNSFIMVAVPLFILCGSLMDEGGVADKIYDLAESMVGWIFGGLGHVSVVVNMLFAGMSGSSVAAIASIGKMSINALEKKGYPKDYATAINLSGSMLASVIPPSILMINAAATANVSIGQALLAGLIPGIIIGLIFMIYNYFYCKKHNIGDRTPFQGKRLGKAFVSAIPALLTPVILLGGVYTGFYTPTEGAAIAVVYTILVSVYVYKNLKWRDIPRIICKNARSTGTILFVAIAAKPASLIFELDGLPSAVANMITGISRQPYCHHVCALPVPDLCGHVHGCHSGNLHSGSHPSSCSAGSRCISAVLRGIPGNHPVLRTDHPAGGRMSLRGAECHGT